MFRHFPDRCSDPISACKAHLRGDYIAGSGISHHTDHASPTLQHESSNHICMHAEAVCGVQVTQRTVRDKFAVLSQMGTLLSLEGVSEVMDYWDSSTTWRLTDAQVKEILGQRTDFDPLEIASLDL